MRRTKAAAVAALFCIGPVCMGPGAASAEVLDTGPQGFRLKAMRQIAAPPGRVYEALGEIGRWWDGAHSYSGKAENMSVRLEPGGCWCEALPGGGVRHGTVILAWPEQGMLRLDAPLGPLQDEGVSAVLSFQLRAKDGGTELTAAYHVGGARDFILKAAPAVDGVLNAAWDRLTRYVETGTPEP
ncbi:ATPase [Phenylobacterium sp. SCN 70-31]|uniref:ATPase n=1 Tax=Phenylobacterium sp. SCN 70-31 TaxID=1660129 RepID=UPI0025E8B17C|nr:ATPase [Phenylobacterium sp. SCN 70-31]